MSERDEITEIWMRLRSSGEGSHAVPSVDLKYYFKSGSENEIVCLSYSDWRDRTEKIWWAVAGTEDAEQARAVLEKFFDARLSLHSAVRYPVRGNNLPQFSP